MEIAASPIETYEISPRFRQTMETRIARLDHDAKSDELVLSSIQNEDHLLRHQRLIDVQRNEASRMRQFLDRSRTRQTSC